MIMTSEEYAKAIDKTVFPGLQGGPLMHVIAGKAVAFGEALEPSFKEYAASVIENAKVLADELRASGMPIISGGTDTHLMLVDVTPTGMSGRQVEELLDKVGITVNKNTIPGETRPPTQASGIRLGSPAVTTRGFGPVEMQLVARMIIDVLQAPDDDSVHARVGRDVAIMTSQFSIPGISASTL
jgi:glycine hydroxymethyltransferase